MVSITFVAFVVYVPDAMQFTVFPEKMLATKTLHRNIPYSHTINSQFSIFFFITI